MSRTDPHAAVTAVVQARAHERTLAHTDPAARRRLYLHLVLGARARGRWATWWLRGHVDPRTGHVPAPVDLLALALALPTRVDNLLGVQDWAFTPVRTRRQLARELARRRGVLEGLHRLLTGNPAADTVLLDRLYLADDLAAEVARLTER